jgi:hypothetical protein
MVITASIHLRRAPACARVSLIFSPRCGKPVGNIEQVRGVAEAAELLVQSAAKETSK